MTVNWENLKYKMCPKCGYDRHFLVNVVWHGQVRLHEDGTEEMSGGHTLWEESSYVQCPQCDWDGEMKQLEWMKEIPPIFSSNLITLVEYCKLTVQECTHEEALTEMDLEDEAFENVLEFLDDLLTEIG